MTTTLGNRLAVLRKGKGLKQADAAAAVDISRSYLAGIESDGEQPGREVLQRLALFYEVSLDYLVGRPVKDGVGVDQLVQDQLFQIQQAWPRLDPEGRLAIATLVAKLAAPPRRKSA